MLAVWLVCWLFSCACMCLLPCCGVVGVGALWGWVLSVVTDEHTVGFTFNTV